MCRPAPCGPSGAQPSQTAPCRSRWRSDHSRARCRAHINPGMWVPPQLLPWQPRPSEHGVASETRLRYRRRSTAASSRPGAGHVAGAGSREPATGKQSHGARPGTARLQEPAVQEGSQPWVCSPPPGSTKGTTLSPASPTSPHFPCSPWENVTGETWHRLRDLKGRALILYSHAPKLPAL